MDASARVEAAEPRPAQHLSTLRKLEISAITIEIFGLLLVVGWLLSFWTLVLRARLELGFWPYPRSGSPLDGSLVLPPLKPGLEYPLHRAIGLPFLFLSFYVVPIALPISVLLGALPRTRPMPWLRAAFVVLAGFAVWQFLVDPGQFWRWYLD